MKRLSCAVAAKVGIDEVIAEADLLGVQPQQPSGGAAPA